jgi:nucleotide-binding universal stress UspA family protein
VDVRRRVACITVVPPAASLTDDTETGRHIKHLVNLRRWAKPLELPEERLTYHVLESEKPAAALIDYASMNDVDQILIGAPRSAAHRWFAGVSAQVVGEAPCSVTVVRPRRDS